MSIEGPPALLVGLGRWQGCLLSGYYTAEDVFVDATHAGADALPVCEVAANPHLPRRPPAPAGRSCGCWPQTGRLAKSAPPIWDSQHDELSLESILGIWVSQFPVRVRITAAPCRP